MILLFQIIITVKGVGWLAMSKPGHLTIHHQSHSTQITTKLSREDFRDKAMVSIIGDLDMIVIMREAREALGRIMGDLHMIVFMREK